MMKYGGKYTLIYIQIAIAAFAVCLFLQSFLVLKPRAKIGDQRPAFTSRKIDKCILMVIDAMRLDLVNEMPYVNQSLREKKSSIFKTHVYPPTVTMPRIKAITSGSIPNFVDIILNFGNTELKEDNIIQRAHEQKLKMTFYGDETWLKLFPSHFDRHDGTSSFFVTDYTEVDDNVTRHLDNEMKLFDWDILILHYLGLDHIGHLEGTKSQLVKPKLIEMDNIIRKIHMAFQQKTQNPSDKYVFMVTGDHGMKDSGGHGGTSYVESNVPLIFIGQHFNDEYISEIAQTDIACTLSLLLGLPVPSGSIGIPILSVLQKYFSPQELTVIFEQYVHHLLVLASSSVSMDKLNDFHEKLNELKKTDAKIQADQTNLKKLISNYQNLTLELNQALRAVSLKYDLEHLVIAIIIFSVATIISLITIIKTGHTILITLFAASTGHALSFFSTSFIEEEHQSWYFLLVSVFLFLAFKSFQNEKRQNDVLEWFFVLTVLRFLRTLNQTGDQWAHLPDFGDFLNESSVYLTVFCIFGLILTYFILLLYLNLRLLTRFLVAVTLFLIYISKAHESSNLLFTHLSSSITFQAKLAFISLNLTVLFSFCENHWYALTKQRVLNTLILYAALFTTFLLRPHNVILVPCLIYVSAKINRTVKCINVNTMLQLWLGNAFYFYMGNSNSVANIDITPGYLMQTKYNEVIVGFLIFLHTYSMQILTYLLIMKHICDNFANSGYKLRYHLKTSMDVVLAAKFLPVLICMASLTLHRNHLFIWSVFSPKLLYESCNFFLAVISVLLSNFLR